MLFAKEFTYICELHVFCKSTFMLVVQALWSYNDQECTTFVHLRKSCAIVMQ